MEFSPKHRKSSCTGRCCVLNCTSDNSKNLNLSFHKVPKCNSERWSRINIFGNKEFVDNRSEWLRKLNIVDNGREFLVCSLHFRSEDYNSPGKFSYTSIFHLNYSIIELCVIYFMFKREDLEEICDPVTRNNSKQKEAANLERKRRYVGFLSYTYVSHIFFIN